MNKKIVILTTSLLIGGTLLGTTAFAGTNSASGYETYKNALLNMRNIKSLTDAIQVSALDNGTSLLSADLTLKVNKNLKGMSGDVDFREGNTEKKGEVYRQNNETIIKDSSSDVYNIVQLPNGQAKGPVGKPDAQQVQKRMQNMESIVDSLIGNEKSYFVLTVNSDGTKSVNVKFSENQISPVVNTIVSAVVKSREDMIVNKANIQGKLGVELPMLDKDIRITGADLTAVINKDGILTEQKGTLTLAGIDASGKEHSLALNLDMNISNINSTNPDTVDLNGKQVKTVGTAEFKHSR